MYNANVIVRNVKFEYIQCRKS